MKLWQSKSLLSAFSMILVEISTFVNANPSSPFLSFSEINSFRKARFDIQWGGEDFSMQYVNIGWSSSLPIILSVMMLTISTILSRDSLSKVNFSRKYMALLLLLKELQTGRRCYSKVSESGCSRILWSLMKERTLQLAEKALSLLKCWLGRRVLSIFDERKSKRRSSIDPAPNNNLICLKIGLLK